MKLKTIGAIITAIIFITTALVYQQNKTDIAKASYSNNPTNLSKMETKNYKEKSITTSHNPLNITIKTDKVTYSWIGEPVIIELTITNNGDTNQTLIFPTSKQHDFIIKNKHERNVFRWSEKFGFAQVFTELTIPPGEYVSWNYTWNQYGHLLQFMPYHKILPGSYTIIGQIPSTEECYEEIVQIKITPL